MSKSKILFFIDGSVPSKEDKEKASLINGTVCFRNVRFFDPSCCLETADFLVGLIPEKYKMSSIPEYRFKSEVENEQKEEKKQEVEVEVEVKKIVWKPRIN